MNEFARSISVTRIIERLNRDQRSASSDISFNCIATNLCIHFASWMRATKSIDKSIDGLKHHCLTSINFGYAKWLQLSLCPLLRISNRNLPTLTAVLYPNAILLVCWLNFKCRPAIFSFQLVAINNIREGGVQLFGSLLLLVVLRAGRLLLRL